MKKILIFVVDTASGLECCSIYHENVNAILKRFATLEDWANRIFEGCVNSKVKSVVVIDCVRIAYYF